MDSEKSWTKPRPGFEPGTRDSLWVYEVAALPAEPPGHKHLISQRPPALFDEQIRRAALLLDLYFSTFGGPDGI